MGQFMSDFIVEFFNCEISKQLLRFKDSPTQIDRTWSRIPEIAALSCNKYGGRVNRLFLIGT